MRFFLLLLLAALHVAVEAAGVGSLFKVAGSLVRSGPLGKGPKVTKGGSGGTAEGKQCL